MQTADPALPTDDLPPCLRTRDDVLSGAEPVVAIGGPVGVLLLHGFTGSPWEVSPLVAPLAADGFTLALPRLAGHGTCVDDLERTRWQDWLASANAALSWLQARTERVHLVGLSMGALLCLKFLRQQPHGTFASIMLLAPALTLGAPTERAIRLAAAMGWPQRIGKDPPELARGLLPPGYWQIPVATTASFLDLCDDVRGNGPYSGPPMRVLHGDLDRTIPMRRARTICRQILPGVPHKVIRGAGHLLPRTWQAKRVIAQVQRHIREADAALSM